MAFLSRLHGLVEAGSQFLIATHSPILMAYPDAVILLLEAAGPPRPVAYRDTEHYRVTRDFLTRPEPMLDILLDRGSAVQPGTRTRSFEPTRTPSSPSHPPLRGGCRPG